MIQVNLMTSEFTANQVLPAVPRKGDTVRVGGQVFTVDSVEWVPSTELKNMTIPTYVNCRLI